MKKRLTFPQQHALGVLFNSPVEVGYHAICGIRNEQTLRLLESRGLVAIIGERKTRWALTPDGKVVVAHLLATGELVREE